MNDSDEINCFFMNNYQNKIGIFVKLVSKVSTRWKNWREFKSYESMNFREEDWSKIRTLFLNSRQEFRNYRMKSIVWMTREILGMSSQYAVDFPTFPVNRRYFHLVVIQEDCWAANDKPPDIWNTQGISGNVFANPPASSSSPYPRGFNPWISNVTEGHVTACNEWTSDSRHSLGSQISVRPTAGNSFDPDKFPTPTTFACWKIRFKTEVCTCSQFPTEAMLWSKEVEMVESVDDLKSSRSIRRTPGPNFELLDARLASALNKIIQNTRFKKKDQSGGNESSQRKRVPSRKTDRLPDLRTLPGHWGQRFCRELCPPIDSCSSKWRYSGIRFEMGRFFFVPCKTCATPRTRGVTTPTMSPSPSQNKERRHFPWTHRRFRKKKGTAFDGGVPGFFTAPPPEGEHALLLLLFSFLKKWISLCLGFYHMPSATSLFELDLVFDVDRAFVCDQLRRSLLQYHVICCGYTSRC